MKFKKVNLAGRQPSGDSAYGRRPRPENNCQDKDLACAQYMGGSNHPLSPQWHGGGGVNPHDQKLLMVAVRNLKSINRELKFIVKDITFFLVYKNYSYDLLSQHNYHPPLMFTRTF
jgi:hypothetical protein